MDRSGLGEDSGSRGEAGVDPGSPRLVGTEISIRRADEGMGAPLSPIDPDSSAPRYSGDRVLAQRALLGDRDAVDLLVERMCCVPRFLALRNRRLGSMLSLEDLRDLTQEVLGIAWQKLAEFRGDAALETWLFAISARAFLNAARRHARRKRSGVAGEEVLERAAVARDVPIEDYAHVHACLEQLPEQDARIVRERAFEGREFAEIAASTGHSISALKARYYRALQALRACLGPYLRRER